jgi:hypothetical protein
MGYQISLPTGKKFGKGPQLLFSEDFESPNVTHISGYEEGLLPTGWIGTDSDAGFGWSEKGLNDSAVSTDFVVNSAFGTQGLDFNYTNSGACTGVGAIGTIDINTVTYRVTFVVTYDKANVTGKSNGGTQLGPDYHVKLSAFPGGFDRASDMNAVAAAPYEMAELSGSVADDNVGHEFSFEYTTDPVTDAALSGNDLAVVFEGSTNHGIYVKLKVEIIP